MTIAVAQQGEGQTTSQQIIMTQDYKICPNISPTSMGNFNVLKPCYGRTYSFSYIGKAVE